MSGLFGGGSQKISTSAPLVASMRLQTSVSGRPIAVVLGRTRVSGNLLQYVDFTAIPHTSVSSSGGGGKGGGGGATQENTTYSYTAGILMALCAGEIDDVLRVWKGKSIFTLAGLGLSLYVGDFAQTAYPYMVANHPDVARAHRGLAYVASGAYQLDDNASLENHNFEVQGALAYSVDIPDAEVGSVLELVITDDALGLGLPSSVLGDWSDFDAYCLANGIFVSPAYTEREPAAQVIQRLAEIGNGGLVWSEDKLKLVSYSDTAATGNGATFTPDLTPVYDFDDRDYLDKDEPVKLTRPTAADAFNQLVLKYFNRDNDYNEDPKEAKDQADIDLNGVKPDPEEQMYHEIARSDTAQTVADARLRRKLYGARNTYTTRVHDRYDLLEAMDLVTLTDADLGLDRQLVRVIEISDNEDQGLDLTCEEMLVGSAAPAAYESQASSGYAADYNAAPGDVNDPVMFVAPYTLSLGALELWIAISGGEEYGGCEIWASDDDATYKRLGTFRGMSRTGVTTSAMAVQADPDTVTTLGVNLSESAGTLLAGTQQDANRFNTLCYAGGELFAYRDATLTGTNQYNLSALRRGAYGSTITNVPAGSDFVRVDNALFKHAFPPEFAGRTLYLKFPAFNRTGGGKQQLADVDAYTFVLSQQYAGVPVPPGVSGLEVFGQGNDTEFVGRDAKFVWRQAGNQHSYDLGSEPFGSGSGGLDPYFRDFEIQISNAAGDTVLRTEHTADTFYTYTYEKNAEDGGGVATREFTISVWQRNIFGRVSYVPAVLTVSNPQPALPTGVNLRAAFKSLFIGYTAPADTDFAGLLAWVSTSPGFTPGPLNLAYQGNDTLVVIDAQPGTDYYVRYASFDTFGVDGVTVSGELAISTAKIVTGDIASAAVTTALIALDAITNDLIAANAVTVTEIADDSISTPKLIAGSVVTGKLATGAVTANEIAAGAITTVKLTAGAVTANEISSGAITTGKLAAFAVTAGEIATDAVTAAKIQAGAVTATKISVSQLSAITADLGAITAGSLNIGAGKFVVDSSGNVTITNSASGARLEITNSVIRVYDSGGVLRVKLGDLT